MIGQKEHFQIKSYKTEFTFLKTCVTFCFFILIGRLWFLQIHNGSDFRHFSNANRLKKQILIAPRGIVFDRNNKILIENKTIVELKMDLNYIKNLKETLYKISQIIHWPVEKIERRVEQQKKRYGLFHPLTIKRNLNLEEIYKLKLLHWDISGVYVQESIVRTYPLKENASQVLGFVGQVSKKEIKILTKSNPSIYQEEIIGKSGLEKRYDSQLRGVYGLSLVEVDAYNRITQKTKSPYRFQNREPVQGMNLQLTLDKDIQEAAFQAMKRSDSIGPRKGSVIVMKTNGEILAWVSEPSFDPNAFSLELNEATWNQWIENSPKTFINKGLQERYSPGSTLKPFIALATLQEKIISEDTLIHSKGSFKLGNQIFHDSARLGHGYINVSQALERSANSFFYQAGLDLGIDKIVKYIKLFNFGSLTEIDLFGEIKGFVPTRKWKKRKFKVNWQLGETLHASIGQGYLFSTLLQLTVAYNTIATEGLIMKPFLRKEDNPQTLDTLTDRIDRKYFKLIKQSLKQVVEGDRGTARFWRNPKFSFSGKTGTSQVVSLSSEKIYKNCKYLPLNKRHHGWFVSFAPSDKPEIIVTVLTEHSCSGSSGSVPVARDIIRAYLKKYHKKESRNHVSF